MPKNIEKTNENQSVARNALAMSAGTLLSRILGFARDALIGSLFGRMASDAFFVAFRLPNLFRRLLGEGSLSVSFIPVYIEARQKKRQGEAKELTSSLLMLLAAVTSVISALCIINMETIINYLVSGKGYQSIPGKVELTVLMARIMFSYLFLVTNYGFLMAMAQAHRKFFVSALAPALFNLTLIIFMLLPAAWFSFDGENLSWGVIAGGMVQLLIVVIQVIKLGIFPKLKWRGFTPETRVVLKNMLPGLSV